MKAPRYIWMTHLWYNRQWWKYFQTAPENSASSASSGTCNSQNIVEVLDGSIGIVPDGYTLSESGNQSYSGLVSIQLYISLYKISILCVNSV